VFDRVCSRGKIKRTKLDADEHGAERMEKRSGMTRPANYWYND